MARTVLPGDCEPDLRLSLANERTFLAWILHRPGAAGRDVAIEAFAVNPFEVPAREALALVLVG